MKRILLILALFISFIGTGKCQEVLESKFLRKIQKSYFFQQFGLFVYNDVELHRVKYTTIDVKGQPTVASGLVCLPSEKSGGYPIVAYHHGTVGSRFDVPGYDSFESTIPAIFAALGYIGTAPDYLGLGDSPGIHPYVHAESEATASRDLLIAAKKFIDSKGYKINNDLFITGYSQGGHAGMALHRMMEKNPLGFTLRATAHLSGPYSISTGMKDLLTGENEYSQVAYLANTALSYNLVYGIFPNNDVYQMFKPTYAKMIEQYAQEKINLWDMNTQMIDSLKKQFGKALPKKMLRDDVLNEINTNPNHPVNVALRDNDVYDWKPETPTRLFYCKADDQVVYTNSLIALAKMKENGSTQVQAKDVNPNANHGACVNPALTNTISFFMLYQQVTSTDEKIQMEDVSLFPNPSNDVVFIKSTTPFVEAIFMDPIGRQFKKLVNDNSLEIFDLPSSSYIVMLKDNKGNIKYNKIVKTN